MQSGRTPQQRLFFQKLIVDRIIAFPQVQKGAVLKVTEFLQRLGEEGNTHLLAGREAFSILRDLQSRIEQLERSSRWRRGMVQIQPRYELAKIIYPQSPVPRLCAQVRILTGTADKLRKRLLASLGFRRRLSRGSLMRLCAGAGELREARYPRRKRQASSKPQPALL